MSQLDDSNEALYAAAVGTRNTGYYMSYFRRCAERGYTPMSWNWPVLFLGVFWLAYRRLYVWACIALLITFLIGTIAGGVSAAGYPAAGSGIYFAGTIGFQLIYLPLHANGIYYRWCGSLIDRVREHAPGQPQEQMDLISRFGGPNRPLIIVVIIALILSATLGGSLQQIANSA